MTFQNKCILITDPSRQNPVSFGSHFVGVSLKRMALSAVAPFRWFQWEHLILRMVWKWSRSVTWWCLCVWLPRPPTAASSLRRASRATLQQDLLSLLAVRTVGVRPPPIPQEMQPSSTEVQGAMIKLKFLDSLLLAKEEGRPRRCVLWATRMSYAGGGCGTVQCKLTRWRILRNFVLIHFFHVGLLIPLRFRK